MATVIGRSAVGAAMGAFLCAMGTADGHAQASPAVRSVQGRVVTPVEDGPVPVPGVWVVLHRVGSDTARALDSVRTDARGVFSFRYRPSGDPNAIYFVSSMRDGIAYFAAPLKSAIVKGEDAEITVFDTTTAAIPIHVRGRHLIVSGADADGNRMVIEVFDLSNDTTRTLVSGTPEKPTWVSILPAHASNFVLKNDEVATSAVTSRDGQVRVYAPLAPGLKQLAYGYTLPASAFPLVVPLERETVVMEILVEDPMATVTAPAVAEVTPVVAEGRSFRRFLGQDLPASAVITLAIPLITTARDTLVRSVLVALVGFAMLAGLGVAYAKRRRSPKTRPAATAAEQLAREVAKLDTEFASNASPDDAARARYAARRAELTRGLSVALASEQGKG